MGNKRKFKLITQENVEIGDVYLSQYSCDEESGFLLHVVTEKIGSRAFEVKGPRKNTPARIRYSQLEGPSYDAILIKKDGGDVYYSRSLADKLERQTIFKASGTTDIGALRPRQRTVTVPV